MPTDITTPNTEYAHVVRTPGIVGGEPRLAETRIRVLDVVAARDIGGLTPEEIASTAYPDLTLAQVYAALAFYEDHKAEIDQAALAEADFVQRFIKEHPELIRDVRTAPAKE
jgi:uncharacterized protein (DUF433 family)